jgi:hypothetical protein
MVNIIKVINFIDLLTYLPSPSWNDNDVSTSETYCSATDASLSVQETVYSQKYNVATTDFFL